MSDVRFPGSSGAPQGVPPHRPGQSPAPAAQPPVGQPTTQQSGPLMPQVPPRPQQPPTANSRTPQQSTLHKLRSFSNDRQQRAASSPRPGNATPGHPPGQAPVGFSQPYPNGGPATAQPYAPRYAATTQPNRGLRYMRAALIGGGLFAVFPSIELLAALPTASSGLGIGVGTLLGYGVPIIVRDFVFGAGLGAATSAIRKRMREKRQQQGLVGQGQQPGMHMQQMPPPGAAGAGYYAAPPQQPWGYPQAYGPHPGNPGAPQQWPTPQQWWQPQSPPGGGPAAQPWQQPPMDRRPTGTFGPPPPGYGVPAPHSPQPQQAGYASPPVAPQQQSNAPAQQSSPIAQPVFPNNSSGATTAAEVIERFAPEKRKEVFDQMLQGLRNYPVASQRAPGFADLARAIPLLSNDARTGGGRVDEQLIAFRMLHAEGNNLSAGSKAALLEALRGVFGSLTPGARVAFLRDNKGDGAAPQTD